MLLPPTFEVDHIVELCDGGKDEYSNLQALCPIIVKVLVKHLKTNNTLVALSLRINNITDDSGIQSIIEACIINISCTLKLKIQT